jgi:23S rRNA pseudouridine955/2504/2580 synthase
MNRLSKGSVSWAEIDESAHGQRIDNFLVKILKGVPRSHIYRILRSGEVRVNSGRVGARYRLETGDRVRIPPVRLAPRAPLRPGDQPSDRIALSENPLFEDESLLAIDKPAGVAVHGGSGVSMGVIERLRRELPNQRFLELVHRLDRETSGVLLLAKKRNALTALHAQLRDGTIEKRYQVLVSGSWPNKRQKVRLRLRKYVTGAGERRVAVDEEGADAYTIFNLIERLDEYSLLEAELKTGRTHQIRVHLSHLGFPIAGDDKYGDFPANKMLAKQGLKRMFLHAESMVFCHPQSGDSVTIRAPLPQDLAHFLQSRHVADH